MSTSDKKTLNPVVEHELALKVYLDSLLFEDMMQETEVAEVPVVTEVQPEVKTETVQVEAVETDVATAESTEVEIKPVVPEVPEWAEGRFECLMFKVAGQLTLSVPLVRLNGIIPWSDEITHVPGHAEWFVGLLASRGKQVKVIDIAKFVIPENHKARESLSQERQFKHIILVDNGTLGLACDGLGDVLKLSKDEVRWRSERSSRPWLAGTVIEYMCALIDVSSFVSMLKDDVPADEITE